MPGVAVSTTALPRPDWLPKDVWPFENAALDVNGRSVAFADVGRGPTLVFYTGIGSFIWRDVILRLMPTYRCVVLDPPGIGLSGSVPRGEATLQRSSEAVAALIDALDLDEIVLVVHDSAGPPALAAAGRVPRRVRGLVGVNTFGWRPSGAAFRAMLALVGNGVVRRLDLATDLIARLTTTDFGVGRHLDEASCRAYRAGIARSEAAFHDYLNDARHGDAIFMEVARALAGPLRQLPLLTIFGARNDPFGFQARWKGLFPGVRQVVVPKGNHFPMCDDPELVAQAIAAWHRDVVAPGTGARR